jgi:hypothetical protein
LLPHARTPPYPQRLLAESWRALRPPVQEALRAAPKRDSGAAAEAAALATTARQLDAALAARGAAGEAWRLYRRLLVFYGQVRLRGAGAVGRGEGAWDGAGGAA